MIFKKIDSERLIFRVFLSSLIIFLLFMTISFLKNKSDIESVLEKNENDLMLVSENLVESVLNCYYRILEDSIDQIIGDEEIIEAFANRDRHRLKQLTLSSYNILYNFGIKQYQFHLPDNRSFLRVHKPDYHGDDLSDFRKMVVDVNSTQIAIKGIEEGVAGLGVRHIAPVFFEGVHIGSVELGISLGENFLSLLEEATCCRWDIFPVANLEAAEGPANTILNRIKNRQPVYLREKEASLFYIPLADYSDNVGWYLVRHYNKSQENILINRQKRTNYIFALLTIFLGP